MARRRFFQMRNWDRFQHYKKRNPPWIKIYTDLLSDYDYAQLSDASKSHLHGLWLLAAKTGNRLPWDRKWLKKVIGSENEPNLSELQAYDFIEPFCLQDASKVLVLAETETETETETEKNPPSSPPLEPITATPPPRSTRGTRLPDNWTPSEDCLNWARENGNGLDVSREADRFRDYWIAQPGQKGVKVNWTATWRNWIRRAQESGHAQNGRASGRPLSAPERVERAIEERNRKRAQQSGRLFEGELE